MSQEHHRVVTKCDARLREFTSASIDFRSMPLLTLNAAKQVLDHYQSDYAAARRSLRSQYERTAPHLMGLPNDSQITGQVGGLAVKQPAQTNWGATSSDPAHGREVRPFQPITRSMRPVNARGESSFHLSIESISKNHVQYQMPTKSGRRARPADHIHYLEDEEKRAHLSPDIPIDPEKFAHYQEREMALAVSDADYLITNIKGQQADRLDLFRAAGDFEKSNRPPIIWIDTNDRSERVTVFLQRAKKDEALSAALQAAQDEIKRGKTKRAKCADKGKVWFAGDDGMKAYDLLNELGWRESHQNPENYHSHGIEWDPGKSGRIQFRVIGELPREADDEARKRILKKFARKFDELGVPYVLVMHRPTYANDADNWHFHLIYWDRPAERFDPMRVQVQLANAGSKGHPYSKRCARFFQSALKDPAVIAQAGRYDFEVEYRYTDKKGRENTVRPFVQNKNRQCTRTIFVEDLRKLLADATNKELELAGAFRRVRPEKFEKFGIKKSPGEKLFDSDHRAELSGIPTDIGTKNERKQWEHIEQLLVERKTREENEMRDQWSRIDKELSLQALDNVIKSELCFQWIDLRMAEINLRDIARRAKENAARLLSRPNAIADNSMSHLAAIMDGSASKRVRKSKEFHLERLKVIGDHSNAVKLLFKDELQLKLEAEREAEKLSEKARQLLIKHGLGIEGYFEDVATDLVLRQPSPVRGAEVPRETLPTVATPQSDLKAAPAIGDAGRNRATAGRAQENLRRQEAREGNAQIEVIARNRVPFTHKPETRSDGRFAIILTIDRADCQRYRLPERIVVADPRAVRRIVRILEVRQQQDQQMRTPAANVDEEMPTEICNATADPHDPSKGLPVEVGVSKIGSGVPEPTAAGVSKTLKQGVGPAVVANKDEVQGPEDGEAEPLEVPGTQNRSSDTVPADARSDARHSEEGSVASDSSQAPASTSKVSQAEPASRHVDGDHATADRFIRMAERRRLLVLPHPSGLFAVRADGAENGAVVRILLKPANQVKLQKIYDQHSTEIDEMAERVAANPGILRKSSEGWEAGNGASPQFRALLVNWQDNDNVQRALDQIVRLPRVVNPGADEVLRRSKLFVLLIVGADWAFDQVDEEAKAAREKRDRTSLGGSGPNGNSATSGPVDRLARPGCEPQARPKSAETVQSDNLVATPPASKTARSQQTENRDPEPVPSPPSIIVDLLEADRQLLRKDEKGLWIVPKTVLDRAKLNAQEIKSDPVQSAISNDQARARAELGAVISYVSRNPYEFRDIEGNFTFGENAPNDVRLAASAWQSNERFLKALKHICTLAPIDNEDELKRRRSRFHRTILGPSPLDLAAQQLAAQTQSRGW